MPSAIVVAFLLWIVATPALAQRRPCGEVVTLATHDRTTTRYALAGPTGAGGKVAVVLMAGGAGHVNLDDGGCPRALVGNSLVRSIPLFHKAGFVTALVDAPSDHHVEDGLGGFRIQKEHADDLGKVIADVRARTGMAVWLIGTSRGAISAANAPDGLVLTSAVMFGSRGQKPWVMQSVFDLPLEKITMPVLVVGHVADACLRSPPGMMEKITAQTNGPREQVVTVTGGPGSSGPTSLAACEGRSPHGFIEQEAEVAAGIARFIGGEKY